LNADTWGYPGEAPASVDLHHSSEDFVARHTGTLLVSVFDVGTGNHDIEERSNRPQFSVVLGHFEHKKGSEFPRSPLMSRVNFGCGGLMARRPAIDALERLA
jgi:hypothetical protein